MPAVSPSPSPTASAPGAPASPGPVASASPVPPPPGGASNASLYLGDLSAGAVFIYSSNANGAVAPSATIAGARTGITDSTGASPLFGIAVDSSGTTYVLTQTHDANNVRVAETIDVFVAGAYGNVAPTRTIALSAAIDGEALAVAGGDLFVADDAGTGAVDVFAASASGATPPLRTFAPNGGFAQLPNKITFDTAGNVYVATVDPTATAASEATQGVYRFPAGASGTVAATQLSGAATGFGNGVLQAAVVDGAHRTDAVLTDRANDRSADIDEFAADATGNAAPATSFNDATADAPVDAAVDAANALYVTEIGPPSQSARVNVFANGATTPMQSIQAYGASLPLVAIGPYVAANATGTSKANARFARLETPRALLSRRRAARSAGAGARR